MLQGFIQFNRILFLLLIQLVQAGLHGGDFALHRLDASVICTAQIQQKVFFFGEQLFDFFCERRNLPGQVVLLDEVQLGGILLFCHQGLASFGLLPGLLRNFVVPLQFRLSCLNCRGAFIHTPDNCLDLIADHDQLLPQLGQLVGDGGGRIGYKLGQHGDQILQLPQQRVVGFDLPVQLTSVRDDALLLHRTGSNTFMDGGLLIQSALGVAAVINTLSGANPFQVQIDDVRPCAAPEDQLAFAVPALGDGILPAVGGAFRMLGGTLQALGFAISCGHVYFLLADQIGVLLLPALVLRLEKFRSCEAALLVATDAQILLFRFVLPLSMLVQGTDCQ